MKLPEQLCSIDNLKAIDVVDCSQLISLAIKGRTLRALNHLAVSSSNVAILPGSFDGFPGRRRLKLDTYCLRRLPSRIGALSSLEVLDLKSEKLIIMRLPDDICLLSRLRLLSVIG